MAELKGQKKDMLASALAHGRVLSLSQGRVRLGFSPQDGMFRRQVERAQKDAEAALSKVLGAPAGLVLEAVQANDVEAAPSLAEEETERTRVREERAVRDSREHPNVLAAMRLLGAVVESIKVLEEEQVDEFAPAPEEGDDGGPDDA
ncbi:MAG: hypothetical protein HY901_31930 [Deltaproteobacteria bacterium]|nr:hypothetical protein [Deltaproteobacteria bacterium]